MPELPTFSFDGHSIGTAPSGTEIARPYTDEDVTRLRGSVRVEHTLARRGAENLRELLAQNEPVAALGCLTGGQAVQAVKAGLKAIYLSGWQVAADANSAGQIYPDQSLYPYDSVPKVVERINNAFMRADQIDSVEGRAGEKDWFAPIVADMEAGFGGPLNVFELAKSMIQAGAAGVHLEDQLASEKKCGHLGGKVLIPTQQAVRNLIAARLAMDVCDTPTVLIARTDADAANLLLSDVDDRDKPFCTGERTPEGFYRVKPGIDQAIARGLAYAPYADLIWCETSHPSLEEAKAFADGIHAQFPGKMLAYNCSPSFNWKLKIDEETIAQYREKLFEMGYRFQFITLAGWHALNHAMFELAYDYNKRGMSAYADFQAGEFASEPRGYTATRHQREVGTGYFDEVAKLVSGGESSTTALTGSTEEAQFKQTAAPKEPAIA
ncbi:MAG: isocitrate lyase [Candidatus Elarobacter sp.]